MGRQTAAVLAIELRGAVVADEMSDVGDITKMGKGYGGH
jgi:hypothetical protein